MYEYNVKILKVIDGDTVDVDIDLGFGVWLHKERVRMMGIDTPESRTRDLEEKKFGLLSKEYVENYLQVGSKSKMVCKSYDAKGKFGRILGDFIVEGYRITEILVDEGHAVGYHGQSKEDIRDEHNKNRQRLVAEGKVIIEGD